jgi:ribosomal protein S12 methylthiotransferase
MTKENPSLRVGLVSLGCAKNLVDSEILAGTLLADGFELTNDTTQADVVIINTCSFIESAQQESVDTILESAELREANRRGQGLIVAGCLPQRFRAQLPALLPEVDVFMGIDQLPQVAAMVNEALARRKAKLQTGRTLPSRRSPRSMEQTASSASLIKVTARPRYIPDYSTPRFRLTPKHFAYVKIADGCNHPCSFCIIPGIRGSHRSREQADIVAEARALIAEGVKELNLISQDSTYYGLDLRPSRTRAAASPQRFAETIGELPAGSATLCTLLRELNSLSGDFWIRLLYTHPAHWTSELIQAIAECPKVARYIDLPLQHIHPLMLERMRRETSPEHIIKLLAEIRRAIPGIAIRTTFIVGFPGETQACFEALLDFIRQIRFERLGVFTYSPQEGTRAGGMAGQVPEKVKQERRKLTMAVQHEVAVEVASAFLGRTIRVLVEGRASARDLKKANVSSWEHGLVRAKDDAASSLHGSYWVARGEADAPDIDGRVYIRGRVLPGQFACVRIVGHTDYDLIAEPA